MAAIGVALAVAVLIIRAMIRRRDRREFERQQQFLLDLEHRMESTARATGELPVITISGPVSDATKEAIEQVAIAVTTRVRCLVCGRPLIKHASQQLGFGPTCHKRVQGLEITPRDT